MTPEIWTLCGAGVVTLGAVGGAWFVRRSAHEGVEVEHRKVDLDEFRAVTSELRTDLTETRVRLDQVESERKLDNAWIDLLRIHIVNGNPPPPPSRPTHA